ncbi:MAG: 50S ribosomal protein L9 [Candidatus Omnitrophota bacterium]|jgi:large subunit ribosomal protein L9|nr:MAG: 50S ribosomal protein L9 [Candidatus Omnitrophota bacterium]
MDIILRESVANLGEAGDLVDVKGGYARNYLIPQGLAYSAASANAAQINHKKRLLEDQRKRRIKTEQDLAKRLSEISINIPVRVGEEDRVFGSVTSQNIADSLAKKGYDVDRRKIVLDEPIRALGVYTVPVRFSGDISGNVKVWVVKEES